MYPRVVHIEHCVPDSILSNSQISERFPSWPALKIFKKTGILTRHIASDHQTAADLAISAAVKLFTNSGVRPSDVDFLLFVTQTPNQLIPTSACQIHHQLNLRPDCGAIDINQGCTGYIYGLNVASSLISSGNCRTVLLLTGDTYSKLIDPQDVGLVTLFGDGASASLLSADSINSPSIGPFLFGTDGSKSDLMFCSRACLSPPTSSKQTLFMNGPGIMSFTLQQVPTAVESFLSKNNLSIGMFDYVLLHQANKYMIDRLYDKLGASDKGIISLSAFGNTVSSSIPFALSSLMDNFQDRPKGRILLVGFGVGLSWGVTWINYCPDV